MDQYCLIHISYWNIYLNKSKKWFINRLLKIICACICIIQVLLFLFFKCMVNSKYNNNNKSREMISYERFGPLRYIWDYSQDMHVLLAMKVISYLLNYCCYHQYFFFYFFSLSIDENLKQHSDKIQKLSYINGVCQTQVIGHRFV